MCHARDVELARFAHGVHAEGEPRDGGEQADRQHEVVVEVRRLALHHELELRRRHGVLQDDAHVLERPQVCAARHVDSPMSKKERTCTDIVEDACRGVRRRRHVSEEKQTNIRARQRIMSEDTCVEC